MTVLTSKIPPAMRHWGGRPVNRVLFACYFLAATLLSPVGGHIGQAVMSLVQWGLCTYVVFELCVQIHRRWGWVATTGFVLLVVGIAVMVKGAWVWPFFS